MNSSSPGANRLNLDPASSTERITRAPGQSSAESLPTLPVPDYMTQIQYQITEEKGFFHNNISTNLPPTTSSPTFLSRPVPILQGDIKQIPNTVAETSFLFDPSIPSAKIQSLCYLDCLSSISLQTCNLLAISMDLHKSKIATCKIHFIPLRTAQQAHYMQEDFWTLHMSTPICSTVQFLWMEKIQFNGGQVSSAFKGFAIHLPFDCGRT